jgi:hypothetical protein
MSKAPVRTLARKVQGKSQRKGYSLAACTVLQYNTAGDLLSCSLYMRRPCMVRGYRLTLAQHHCKGGNGKLAAGFAAADALGTSDECPRSLSLGCHCHCQCQQQVETCRLQEVQVQRTLLCCLVRWVG